MHCTLHGMSMAWHSTRMASRGGTVVRHYGLRATTTTPVLSPALHGHLLPVMCPAEVHVSLQGIDAGWRARSVCVSLCCMQQLHKRIIIISSSSNQSQCQHCIALCMACTWPDTAHAWHHEVGRTKCVTLMRKQQPVGNTEGCHHYTRDSDQPCTATSLLCCVLLRSTCHSRAQTHV
jgi:hypothetical protein